MQSLLLCFLAIVSTVRGSVSQSEWDAMFLRFYTGRFRFSSSLESYIDRGLKNATSILKYMDMDKPTALYLHGYTESVESISVRTVVDGYSHRKDHNVIALDYRNTAGKFYVTVAESASTVGVALANALDDMVKNGLKAESLHIVAHSLGAQVAGYCAGAANFQLKRITGLDPAGPLFNFLGQHLSKTDAMFVDIIHTDRKFYGNIWSSGTVNFYPNGGRRIQPGCPMHPLVFSNEDFCSHHRSWEFYAESLWKEDSFMASECPFEKSFNNGDCDHNKVIAMGIATPTDAQGSYFLRTADKSPFGLGIAGAKADKKQNSL